MLLDNLEYKPDFGEILKEGEQILILRRFVPNLKFCQAQDKNFLLQPICRSSEICNF